MSSTGLANIFLLLIIFHSKSSIANPVGYTSPEDIAASNDGSGNATGITIRQQVSTSSCQIKTDENLMDYIDLAEKEEKVTLFEFKIKLRNYTYDPFYNITGRYFKPWLWYTTRSRHGRTLLLLSFHYDVLSMNILTIGVKQLDAVFIDTPHGCFGHLPTEQQVKQIRALLLSRNNVGQSTSYGKSAREEFACNQEIQDKDGEADFVYACCFKDSSGELDCTTKGEDFWINILYMAITVVKILMFLFCPKFVPASAYSATYMASEYMVTLKQKLRMKIFVSEKIDANVKCKNRLTLENISEWWRFRDVLRDLPHDEVVPVEITELRIKVKGKRIIPENDPPTGLLKTLYDNLMRCKIKNLEAFTDCCESSIFASMEPNFRRKISWHGLVKILMKGFMLFLIPVPYYIRLFIYFKFEADEITQRRDAMKKNGLGESFNFLKTNVIQYFTPSHGVFIASYVLYFVCAVIVASTSKAFRNKLKDVARSALCDMDFVSQTGVLGIIIRTLLYPFKRCGLLGLIIGPVYFVLALPLCMVVFAIYCIPTVYMTFRLPYYARKIMGTTATMAEADKIEKLRKMKKLGRKISKIDKFAHSGSVQRKGDKFIPDDLTFRGCQTIQNVAIQISCAVFCLCILYSVALIFAESIGLFVEVISFTMMGIIVNAGSVLKYLSMILLVFVYMNDCYSNVYENYLTFNKTIIDDIIERTTADLRKIASMPSNEQTNTAFHVKCVDEEKEVTPSLNFEKKEVRWKLGQLLLFLDCYDTPRIPLRLFQRLCQVRVHGAPGPVYLNLLAATGKFMIIVVFLMFVMLVVLAFGNVYEMSNTNTTLATLAGGFVPMLLKNVLSSKGAKLSLKTVSFKGQIDEIIGDYRQYWPLTDFVMKQYVPGEDDEEDDENKDFASKSQEHDRPGESGDAKRKKSIAFKTPEKAKPKEETSGGNKKKNPDGVQFSDENDDRIRKDDQKNGLLPTVSKSAKELLEEDDQVDLFIDLSVADVAGWSIYGSSESLPSEAMMPSYFDPNKINEEYEDNVTTHQPVAGNPPDYAKAMSVSYHPKSSV